MPAVRLSRRRRSSLAISFSPAKAGIYGIPRPVTFAPNVTPVSYVVPEDCSPSPTPEPGSPSASLFPPSAMPAPTPSRRRVPPGKRRSMGYIPRPPNAFMLFRADFVRQKHVPGSIETNHGSLSKIIGNCWRSLPLDEKRVWEVKAKHAKAEHKMRYPEYRFRPVHNKNKDKKKDKPATTIEDERRCEEVAQLLLEGKKGDELAAAVRNLDLMRSDSPVAVYHHRRSSSVPLPNDYYSHFGNIAIPTMPFLTSSRPPSPIGSISRQQRMMFGHRRVSSARPAVVNRSWTMPTPSALQRDNSPLPEVDTSLFERSFLDASSTQFTFPTQDQINFNDLLADLAPNVHQHHDQLSFGPLDSISPHDIFPPNMYHSSSASSSQSLPELDPLSWLGLDPSAQSQPDSHPSTAYSGSPASSEGNLPVVYAPQPQSATTAAFNEIWKEFGGGSFSEAQQQQFSVSSGLDMGLGLDFGHEHDNNNNMSCGPPSFVTGLDSLFGSQMGHDFNDMTTMH